MRECCRKQALSRKKMCSRGIIDSQKDISWIIHVATDKPVF